MQLDQFDAARAAYPGDDIVRYATGRITRNGVDLTQPEIDAAVASYQSTHDSKVAAILESQRIATINNKANELIIAIASEHAQRNMLARGLVLLKKGEANWTTDEAAFVTQLESTWAQIDAIRDASNVAIDGNTDPVWPV